MANWCSNYLRLEHPDKEMLDRLCDAFVEGRLFKEFLPLPDCLANAANSIHLSASGAAQRQAKNMKECGYASATDFAVSQWGTKWDIDGGQIDDDGANAVILQFSSAGSPPLPFYQKLTQRGFTVMARYFESGDQYAGIWENDRKLNIRGWNKLTDLPEELNVAFAVYDMFDHDAEQANKPAPAKG